MIRIPYSIILLVLIPLAGFVRSPKAFDIDTDLSAATWRWHSGKEQHSGTVYVSSGELLAEHTFIQGGTIRVDLNSLSVSTVRDLQHNSRVTGWIKGREFFDTYNHPVAVLRITSVRQESDNRYMLNGSLTVKDKTHPVRVPVAISFGKKKIEMTTQLSIDQMNPGSERESADDAFNLNLHLVAKRR